MDPEVFFAFTQETLRNTVALLDQRIAEMTQWVDERAAVDPEVAGYYDDEIEYLIGIGCLTYQRYISSIVALLASKKKTALNLGPFVPSTDTGFAAAINAAANYWKHHVEWDSANLTGNAQETVDTLRSIGVTTSDSFVGSRVLLALRADQLEALAPYLIQWTELVARENQ